jgi:hypothetical protein
MYAICINIRHKIRLAENYKFEDWESRMSLLTLRNSYYNLRDNFYALNEYNSEKIKESERINKNNNLNTNVKDKEEEKINEKNKTSGETLKVKIDVKSVFNNRKLRINNNI